MGRSCEMAGRLLALCVLAAFAVCYGGEVQELSPLSKEVANSQGLLDAINAGLKATGGQSGSSSHHHKDAAPESKQHKEHLDHKGSDSAHKSPEDDTHMSLHDRIVAQSQATHNKHDAIPKDAGSKSEGPAAASAPAPAPAPKAP